MSWLLSILKTFIGWLAPYGMRLVGEWLSELYLEKQAKQKKEAELEKAKDDYNKERFEAGDDEQAQKDAFDKFVDRTK